MSHNQDNIAHLVQKRIFWEIPESNFYLLIFHYQTTKFEKSELCMSGKLQISWDIRLHNRSKTVQLVQTSIFGKVKNVSLFCPIMMQNFKKILGSSPEIKTCIVLGHNWAKIAQLVQQKSFLETSLKWFLCTYCLLAC